MNYIELHIAGRWTAFVVMCWSFVLNRLPVFNYTMPIYISNIKTICKQCPTNVVKQNTISGNGREQKMRERAQKMHEYFIWNNHICDSVGECKANIMWHVKAMNNRNDFLTITTNTDGANSCCRGGQLLRFKMKAIFSHQLFSATI